LSTDYKNEKSEQGILSSKIDSNEEALSKHEKTISSLESHQQTIIDHDNAEAKERNAALKKSVDSLDGKSLKNSKEIAEAV
jgi:hypothetical protein